MSHHTINFESMPLAYPPALEWIRANDLDPAAVLHKQEVEVDFEALTITLKLFVLTASGAKQHDLSHEPLVQKVTVPLLSAPENHGI